MPRPPPDMPSPPLPARCGSGLLSTLVLDFGIDPVTSLRDDPVFSAANGLLSKRLESLHPAAPTPINAITTNCGPKAKRHAPMVTARTQNYLRANKHR